jgi:anti-anti-sigma factor
MKSDHTPSDGSGRDARSRELGPLLTRIFRGGRTCFVGLTGPLDTVSVDDFRETMARLLAERCRSMVLDLRRVSYADSQGIRALLLLRDQMLQRRGRLRLVIPESSRVRRTLKLLRLDALFQIYATPVEAWRGGRREPQEVPEGGTAKAPGPVATSSSRAAKSGKEATRGAGRRPTAAASTPG